jgi:hypothetical protein
LIGDLLTNDPLLPVKAAATYLGVHPAVLDRWRSRNIGPSYVRLPVGTIRYRLSMLNAFVLMREQQTTRLPALARGRFPVPRYTHNRRPSEDEGRLNAADPRHKNQSADHAVHKGEGTHRGRRR